jgi:hypothetical protein
MNGLFRHPSAFQHNKLLSDKLFDMLRDHGTQRALRLHRTRRNSYWIVERGPSYPHQPMIFDHGA